MRLYTIKDLKNRLEIYPCSSEKGYISYQNARLIELIKRGYVNEENRFNEKKPWQNETPVIWGIDDTEYPRDVKNFAKSRKTGNGGHKLIVMNESYYDNCYYAIENKFWSRKTNPFRRDTRKEIREAIATPVIDANKEKLGYAIENLLNNFTSHLNEKIASFNELFKTKCSRYTFYITYYRSTYVQREIQEPEELLKSLCTQMHIMKVEIKPISITHKDLYKYINSDVALLGDNHYTPEERIDCIADRIYDREHKLIKEFKEKMAKVDNILADTNQLEDAIKIETKNRINNNKNILPNSLVIEHAINNGLLETSFNLSE